MLETYYKYRMEYKDFLLFIKIGNFYEVFDINVKIKTDKNVKVEI